MNTETYTHIRIYTHGHMAISDQDCHLWNPSLYNFLICESLNKKYVPFSLKFWMFCYIYIFWSSAIWWITSFLWKIFHIEFLCGSCLLSIKYSLFSYASLTLILFFFTFVLLIPFSFLLFSFDWYFSCYFHLFWSFCFMYYEHMSSIQVIFVASKLSEIWNFMKKTLILNALTNSA
jgi:hypothetical protein